MIQFILFLAVLSPLGAAPSQALKYRELFERGIEELQSGKYEQAVKTFKQAAELMPLSPTPIYNTACAYSLMGKKKEAIKYLKKAVEMGFEDVEHIQKDTDLDPIRSEKEFKELIAKLKEKQRKEEEKLKGEAQNEIKEALRKTESLFALDFSLKDINGKELSLKKLKGKVVLIDVWGTWCPPCRMQIPHLIRLQKEYGKKGLQVVGLAYERGSPEQQLEGVKRFAKEAAINYPCALIDRSFLSKVPGFRGFPTLILVDRKGKVRFKHLGYAPYGKLAGWVEELLGVSAAKREPREAAGGEKKKTGSPKKRKKRSKWF